MIVLLEAIKAAHVRARERGGGDNILKHMDLPRFRDGDYGMIKFLQKNDNKKFDAGDWYTNSDYNTDERNLRKGFATLIAQLEENDAEDGEVGEKFVWRWWSPYSTEDNARR